MSVTSAGLLPYRWKSGRIELLLVHPGGPFWAKKDDGAWSIGKGEVEGMESPLEAAIREFAQETGYAPQGPFEALTPIRQRSGKTIQAWADRRRLGYVVVHLQHLHDRMAATLG